MSVLAGGCGLAEGVSAREQVLMCFLQRQRLTGGKYLGLKERQLILTLRREVLFSFFFPSEVVSSVENTTNLHCQGTWRSKVGIMVEQVIMT